MVTGSGFTGIPGATGMLQSGMHFVERRGGGLVVGIISISI